jgi:hypothetical protein
MAATVQVKDQFDDGVAKIVMGVESVLDWTPRKSARLVDQ